ncbi:MAG: hypothetical protein ACYT04_40760, partial [Nostoc sp.]
MKPQNLLSIGAGLSIFAALSCAYYYGQNKQPYHYKVVKFCPETANVKPKKYYTNIEKSQQELDKRYCKYSYKLLAEVWEEKLLNDPVPISLGSLQVTDIYPTSNTSLYLLLAPFLAFASYLLWDSKCKLDSDESYQELEAYKVKIKREGLIARSDRSLKLAEISRIQDYHQSDINRRADSKLIQDGFLSLDEMRKRGDRMSELDQQQHNNTLLQYKVADTLGAKQMAENLRDAREANGKFTQTTETEEVGKDAKFKQLTENIKQHEGGWLWEVMTSTKPIWLVGGQGSGKSSLAAAIVLCRHHVLGQKLELVCDAHGHKNRLKAWKYLIPLECEVVGERNNYEAIATGMTEAIARWSDRTENDAPIQSLWDELTQLSMQPECEGEVKKFVRHSLTDVRKANEFLICIAHAFTNAATGNAEGFKELRDQETIQIKRKSKNGRQPLPHAELSGIYDDSG